MSIELQVNDEKVNDSSVPTIPPSDASNAIHVVQLSVDAENLNTALYVSMYQQLLSFVKTNKMDLSPQNVIAILFMLMQCAESYPQLSGNKQDAVLYVMNLYLDNLKKQGKLDDITYNELKVLIQTYLPQVIKLVVGVWNGAEKLADEIEQKCCASWCGKVENK
jgi:hypothetical protein